MEDEAVIESLTLQNLNLEQELQQEKQATIQLGQQLMQQQQDYEMRFKILLEEKEQLENALKSNAAVKNQSETGRERPSSSGTSNTEIMASSNPDKMFVNAIVVEVYKREIVKLREIIVQILQIFGVDFYLQNEFHQIGNLTEVEHETDGFLAHLSESESDCAVRYKVGCILLLETYLYSCSNICKKLCSTDTNFKQLFERITTAKQHSQFELKLLELDKHCECASEENSMHDSDLFSLKKADINRYNSLFEKLKHCLHKREQQQAEDLEVKLTDLQYKHEIAQAKLDKITKVQHQNEKTKLIESFKSTFMARTASKHEATSPQKRESEDCSVELLQVQAKMRRLYQRCLFYSNTRFGQYVETIADKKLIHPAFKQKYVIFNKLTSRAFLFLSQ